MGMSSVCLFSYQVVQFSKEGDWETIFGQIFSQPDIFVLQKYGLLEVELIDGRKNIYWNVYLFFKYI